MTADSTLPLGEVSKWFDVAAVGSLERGDVVASGGAVDLNFLSCAPGESGLAVEVEVEVGHESGVAAVAVVVRVDKDKAMVESHRALGRLVGAVVVPVVGVVEKVTSSGW